MVYQRIKTIEQINKLVNELEIEQVELKLDSRYNGSKIIRTISQVFILSACFTLQRAT